MEGRHPAVSSLRAIGYPDLGAFCAVA